jgi:hypothetical protein
MATTQVIKKTKYGLGTAGHGDLQQQFATVLADYDPKKVLELQQSVIDGVQAENTDVGAIDMDYSASPDVSKFVPNRGWPAGGTTNANEISEGPPAKSSGAGSTESPSVGAAKISKHKIGQYILGKSSEA